MGKLEGKVAIITGAARGIGAAAARLFAEEGALLMLADVLAEPLQKLAGQIGDRAAVSVTDVSDEAAVRSWSTIPLVGTVTSMSRSSTPVSRACKADRRVPGRCL